MVNSPTKQKAEKSKEHQPKAKGESSGISLLQRVSSKKKKREQMRKEAKEQEEKYVQFRKEEILANTRISSHGNLGVAYSKMASLKMAGSADSEDKFPHPKMGSGMDFGVYKAHLLTKKPNPKYATWTNKSLKDGHYIGLDIGDYLSHFRRTQGDKKDRPVVDPEKEKVRVKKGAFEEHPLNDDGEPVWSSESDEEIPTDKDDILVNYETIEEAVLNPKILDFPMSEQCYDWDDNYEDLQKQKNNREEVIKNTLRTVVKLAMPETCFKEDKEKTEITKNEKEIKWVNDVFEYKYNREDVPCNIQPKREKKLLKNAVKKAKKKKEE